MRSEDRARSAGGPGSVVTGECGQGKVSPPTQGRRGSRIRGSCPQARLQGHLDSLGLAVAGMRGAGRG
jgi:hypothetical protein